MDYENLTGPLKAAILIHSMGPGVAERILGNLSDSEQQVVRQHLNRIGTVSPQIIERVAKEFTDIATGRSGAPQLPESTKSDSRQAADDGGEDS